jgi:alpha-D-ribose 1-methylphosphonate 5-triphosphate synthase subunit PhnG
MQRVREPVERRPFNLGEVVVTPAEVDLDGARGFAMRPGKAEREALSGAIVDAAVAGGHRLTGEAVEALRDARAEYENRRERDWDRSQHTTVEFGVMEDDL